LLAEAQIGRGLVMSLPGDIRICGWGEAVTVKSEAAEDSDDVGVLDSEQVVRAGQFVLEDDGQRLSDGLSPGYGWFLVEGPPEGWVYSKYVAGTEETMAPDCSHHDAVEPQ
jgi:hypothetical protein